jgi:hypothetical protein
MHSHTARHGRLLLHTLTACLIALFACRAFADSPNFGPNVMVFDPSMSASSIQTKIDTIFAKQEQNEFGSSRYALLFQPGTYHVDIPVGYYTQVLGLGNRPDDVAIVGYVQCTNRGQGGGALVNFWRGAENLAVDPIDSGGFDTWAVSQASPMRRMHIMGALLLSDQGGSSSGGFLADSVVDDAIISGTQQQWLSRNDQWESWHGSNWNMVFVGDVGGPTQRFPRPAFTAVAQTPVIREKPFLTDGAGGWGVFVPSLRSSSRGVGWDPNSGEPGTNIPIDRFYIAQSGTDTSETINAALAAGKNLLLTPGVYSLDAPIAVTRPGTIVLGLGLATLRPENGVMAMTVADVDGVDVSGILFDAGTVSSPVLLQVGPRGAQASHQTNPITLHDDFFRVGGGGIGKADECLEINSSNVIGDDFWIWRADHGAGVGWSKNVAKNGLVVSGANVTIYGLAVEHFQQYQTMWNGNGGAVYFYQSEEPYDVPIQSEWMAGRKDGYASYKVASGVTSHHAWGLGVYCFFWHNPSVVLQDAIEAPNLPTVRFDDMVTYSLGGGVGTISNVINGTGGSADASNTQNDLVSYP